MPWSSESSSQNCGEIYTRIYPCHEPHHAIQTPERIHPESVRTPWHHPPGRNVIEAPGSSTLRREGARRSEVIPQGALAQSVRVPLSSAALPGEGRPLCAVVKRRGPCESVSIAKSGARWPTRLACKQPNARGTRRGNSSQQAPPRAPSRHASRPRAARAAVTR